MHKPTYILLIITLLVWLCTAPARAQVGEKLDNLVETVTDLTENPELVSYAKAKVQKAMDVGNFIERLDSLTWIEFPVAIKDTINGVPIAIVFDDLRLYPDYAHLEVVVGMELPQQTVESLSNQTVTLSETGGYTGVAGTEDVVGSSSAEYVELYFGTPNLKINHDGGIVGETLVGLYSDVPIGTNDPEKFALILRGWNGHTGGGEGVAQGTYVKIDCDGFVEMGLEADVLFSRDWIVPTNSEGVALPDSLNKRVSARFQTIVTDWNNLLVEVDLPDFALNANREVAFNLSRAIFDFSDYHNGSGMHFPEGYVDNYLPPGEEELWRGVYIKNLSVLLPRQFGKGKGTAANQGSQPEGADTGALMLDNFGEYTLRGPSPPEPNYLPAPAPLKPDADADRRIRFAARDLLIDGRGVSGKLSATNVFPLNDGRMDKRWRYSLDSVGVELTTSKLTSFAFRGKLGVPITKHGQSFGYNGFMNIPDGTYNFTVKTDSNLTFPIFKMGEVRLEQGSYVSVTKTDSSFVPKAVLYGYAQVKVEAKEGDTTGLNFRVAKLSFDGLRLSTVAPRIGLETNGFFQVSTAMDLLGYPLPVVDPTLSMLPSGKVRLRFGVSLNLMNQNDHGFAVNTDVDLLGKLDSLVNYDEYVHDGFNVGKIDVHLSLPALEIKGFAYFFEEDPLYGKGWQGGLDVRVGDKNDPTVEIKLNAIFGHTDFKYWYLDGMAEFQPGLPLTPLPLEINGGGGGIYYHMRMAGMDLTAQGSSGIGTTNSGLTYVPDQNISLGLKMSLAFQSVGEQVIDGIQNLEMSFAGSALQDIMLYGKMEIAVPDELTAGFEQFSDQLDDRMATLTQGMTAVRNQDKQDNSNPQNTLLCTNFMRLNFEYGFEMQGTFRNDFDFAGGAITGSGGSDLLLSRPQNRWHLYLGGYADNSITANDGNPLPPVNVSINLGNNISGAASVYFLLGNDIPGPPPPPNLSGECMPFIGSGPQQNRAALNGRAALGTGLAFGASAQLNLKMRTRRYKCPNNNNSRDICNYACNKWSNNKAEATVSTGFDVSLLKYATDSYCSLSNDSPHGHKGWRATGRFWLYLNVGVRYRGKGLEMGMGAGVEADIPNPEYFSATAKFKALGECHDATAEFGERCGIVAQ